MARWVCLPFRFCERAEQLNESQNLGFLRQLEEATLRPLVPQKNERAILRRILDKTCWPLKRYSHQMAMLNPNEKLEHVPSGPDFPTEASMTDSMVPAATGTTPFRDRSFRPGGKNPAEVAPLCLDLGIRS